MKRWISILTLTLCASIAYAQIVPPRPVVPVLVAPASGVTLRGEAPGATQLQIKWNQWGIFGTTATPLPTYFLVCLKPASQANCTYAANDFLPVSSLANIWLLNGFTHAGYQYTLPLPRTGTTISDTLLDADLTLSIGACWGTRTINCNFSAPSPLYLSARDLKPSNVSDGFTDSMNAVFSHEFDNLGSTEIPGLPLMEVEVIAWQALLNSKLKCRIDYNAADLIDNPDAILFLSDGTGRWIVDLPKVGNERQVKGKVVGIHLWNNGIGVISDTLPFGFALGSMNTGSVDHTIPLPQNLRPRAYINVTWVDHTYTVREYDESNNSRAECNVVQQEN